MCLKTLVHLYAGKGDFARLEGKNRRDPQRHFKDFNCCFSALGLKRLLKLCKPSFFGIWLHAIEHVQDVSRKSTKWLVLHCHV